jgi:undecaprenyl-diphosphatase
MLGDKKEKLAQFSFLMVIPPILGEALLDVLKAMKGDEVVNDSIGFFPLAIGFVAAFLSGCFACKLMINLVKKGKLVYFGIYCAIVGASVLIYQLTR